MNRLSVAIIFITLSLLAVLFFFPVIVVLTNSFMGSFEIFTRYTHLVRPGNVLYTVNNRHFVRITISPSFASLRQYISIVTDNSLYWRQFWNSIGLAVPIVLGQLLIAPLTAYVFEMGRMRYKEAVFFVYIVLMLMPLQVALVPNFIMADRLGLIGSPWAIILPGMVHPFGVFLMRQFLRGLTRDYIEAAQLDGAGHVKIIFLIVLPMFKPALAALIMLTFIDNWNLVEQPLIFLETNVQEPLSVYLAQMAEANLDIVFAASFLYLLPPVLLFLYWQEHMVEGIQLSGIR